MNERQEKLLRLIVEEYVKTARPIGSNSLTKELNVSSATIRNDMVFLEEINYLEKTHLSSGRIPSEKGYKYYVDHLMKPKEVSGEVILKLQTILSNKSLVANDAITKCMDIISEITDYTTIVLGKDSETQTLKQISIVPINDRKVIALLVTDKGYVESRQSVISEDISIAEIVKASEIINKHLSGVRLDSALEKLEFEVKPVIVDTIKQYEQVISFFENAFNDFQTKKSKAFFGGKTNLLNQPEYSEIDEVKKILNKFDDKDFIKKIETDDEDINVFIGKESNFDKNATVIKTSYNFKGEEGTIAIIGPKRMEYNKVVTLLSYIKDNLEDDK